MDMVLTNPGGGLPVVLRTRTWVVTDIVASLPPNRNLLAYLQEIQVREFADTRPPLAI